MTCRVCGGELTPELLAQARAERNLYRDAAQTPNNLGDTAKFERIEVNSDGQPQNRNFVANPNIKPEKERIVPLGPVIALVLTIVVIVGIFATGILKPPEISVSIGTSSSQSTDAQDENKGDKTDKGEKTDTTPAVINIPKVKKSITKYTWDELATISLMMTEEGNLKGAKSVAKEYNLMSKKGKLTTKTRTIKLANGKKVKVRLAGIYHDYDADGKKIGLTFVTTKPVAKHKINSKLNTKGGWKKSDMRSYLNDKMFKLLPEDVSKLVKPAVKQTNNKGNLARLRNVTDTKDKLWLLSFTELCGDITSKTTWYDANDNSNYKIYNAEGKQYQCFKQMGVKMDDPKGNTLLYKYNGKAVAWWLRTPHPNSTKSWHIVSTEVDQTNCSDVTKSGGVVFGFCI